MKKYLVMTAGVSYIIAADEILIADTGVIKLIKDSTVIAALPHGASVIEEYQIVKPEKTAIHKLN